MGRRVSRAARERYDTVLEPVLGEVDALIDARLAARAAEEKRRVRGNLSSPSEIAAIKINDHFFTAAQVGGAEPFASAGKKERAAQVAICGAVIRLYDPDGTLFPAEADVLSEAERWVGGVIDYGARVNLRAVFDTHNLGLDTVPEAQRPLLLLDHAPYKRRMDMVN